MVIWAAIDADHCNFFSKRSPKGQREFLGALILLSLFVQLGYDVDLDELAEMTEGFSGSGLKEVCKRNFHVGNYCILLHL